MKRMHLHVAVENLDHSLGFYSALFGCPPTKRKPDYAKWMLEDPRINFAISCRGTKPGLDHLGLQAEDETELEELRSRIDQAGLTVTESGKTTCCYSQSDKSWVQDPSGIPWEVYHTMADAELYHKETMEPDPCCAPTLTTLTLGKPKDSTQPKCG